MSYKTNIKVVEEDVQSLLYNIDKCISNFEYVTPNMVMAVTESATICFLKGKGWTKEEEYDENLRVKAIYAMVNTLLEYSFDNMADYYWFVEWMEKIQERQDELETFWDEELEHEGCEHE